jgi:hypothetical protein
MMKKVQAKLKELKQELNIWNNFNIKFF